MTNSKYRVILDDLEKKLESGMLCSGDMLPTENEFMQTYQVSRTTVQRALNILVSRGSIYRVPGRGTFVSASAPSASDGDSDHFSGGNFAIVLPYHSPIIIKYLAGAQTYFNRHHANLTIRFSDYTYQGEIELITSLLNEKVDGVIIYPCASTDSRHFYGRLAREDRHIVLIDKQIAGVPLCSVTSNNYQGGRLVAEHLIHNGHNNFAYASPVFTQGTSLLDRFRGFSDTLRQSGLELKREKVLIFPRDESQHVRFFAEYFSSINRRQPLAMFCATDSIAAAAYRAASECGLRIPEDVSIVGYDDLEVARMVNPPLTTVEQPYTKIGEAAARLLTQQANLQGFSCVDLQIPVSLVERSSVFRIKK
ncbi:MAG: GntR family transcriptional regulator [Acutalibacteraceae bacterium]